MAAESDQDKPLTAVMTALTNSVVLREMFTHLAVRDLKRCRLVCTTWNFEAGSYMKDFRRCQARISEDGACYSLCALSKLVSTTKIVAINSLSIELCPKTSNRSCIFRGNPSHVFDQLLDKKFCLKYLKIRCNSFRSDCPTTNFVVTLLREKAIEFRTIGFYLVIKEFPKLFDENWVPYFPKLEVLRFKKMQEPYPDEWDLNWAAQKDLFLRIINAAPNLKKLEGYFDPEMLKSLPQEKYSLLASFYMYIRSAEQEQTCFKIVEAGTRLSYLCLDATKTHNQYLGSFVRLMEQLLNKSWKSLEKLAAEEVEILLTQGTFPSLRKLSVSMKASTDQLLRTFQSIDYAKALPALKEVDITLLPSEDHNLGDAIIELCPSRTVEKLELQLNPGQLCLRDWSEIFPQVTHLTVHTGTDDDGIFPYADLWTCWPELEDVYVDEFIFYQNAMNLDAKFLGIFPEEVNFLRNFDDVALEKMSIVPVRPSILTMSRLKSMEIEIDTGRSIVIMELEPELLFLSKLTGILALRKLSMAGVTIRIICANRLSVTSLNHLVPFASVTMSR